MTKYWCENQRLLTFTGISHGHPLHVVQGTVVYGHSFHFVPGSDVCANYVHPLHNPMIGEWESRARVEPQQGKMGY